MADVTTESEPPYHLYLPQHGRSCRQEGTVASQLRQLPKLILDQALVIAKDDEEGYKDIRKSVAGILFLATPHRGSDATSFPLIISNILETASALTFGATKKVRKDLLKSLEANSAELKDISTAFRNAITFDIISFVEKVVTKPSQSLGWPRLALMNMR